MVNKRIMQTVVALTVAVVALVAAPTPALADKIIYPGQSGSQCSDYETVTTNTDVYWQVCAWVSAGVDEERVWFTAHFGNKSGKDVRIDRVDVDFFVGDRLIDCGYNPAIWVKAHSVAATVAEKCF